MLEDAAARQACYEELSARAARHPAKGANAPLDSSPFGAAERMKRRFHASRDLYTALMKSAGVLSRIHMRR